MRSTHAWRTHPLSTLQVLFMTSGTVFSDGILWMEQFVTTVIFLAGVCLIVYFPPVNYQNWMGRANNDITHFTTLLSGLVAWLISFYVILCINRWWDFRYNGVGNIWYACSQLNLFLSQCAAEEQELLEAIRRYARASLHLLREEQRPPGERCRRLEEVGVLHRQELVQLERMAYAPECIWTWIIEIVCLLRREGKIKDPPLYVFLLHICNEGRSAAAHVSGVINTPIPLLYEHLLCFMVKLHNLLLVVMFAMMGASEVREGHWFNFLQVLGRIFLMPLMYNSILLICELLQNPFQGDLGHFPMNEYLDEVESKASGYVLAGTLLPDCVQRARVASGA